MNSTMNIAANGNEKELWAACVKHSCNEHGISLDGIEYDEIIAKREKYVGFIIPSYGVGVYCDGCNGYGLYCKNILASHAIKQLLSGFWDDIDLDSKLKKHHNSIDTMTELLHFLSDAYSDMNMYYTEHPEDDPRKMMGVAG